MKEVYEYRYSQPSRRRAMLLAVGSAAVLVVLLALLLQQWSVWSWPSRILGVVLIGALFATLQAQVNRLSFRCYLLDEQAELTAFLMRRTIPWQDVVEVRRVQARQVGGERRWACTVYTRSRRGTTLPTYMFDDQLEQADAALAEVVRRTPHAVHTI